MVDLLKSAATGDSASLDTLKSFVENEGYQAGFDPAGNFRFMEWSNGAPIDRLTSVPTISVWGLGLLTVLLGFIGSRRRKK